MSMNDWVRAALNDDDEARTAQRYGQVAMRKGRPYRGSGSAVPSGRATLDNDVLKKLATATDGTTSPAGIDDAYLSQTAETAKDDGMAAPEIAKEYLSYRDDPEWKKWDDIERAAMTSSAWAPIWDANSGGAYSRNKMVNAENARLRKNDIQNFFRDRMSLRLATMPTPERFDYSKGTEEYNRDAGIWERIVYGDRGTRKSTGQTTGPIQKYIDQYGRSGSYEERPGTTPMVRTDKTAATTSESFDVPGFSGGSAEGHQPMEPLGMSPKDAADVAAKNALGVQRGDSPLEEVYKKAQIDLVKAQAARERALAAGGGSARGAAPTDARFDSWPEAYAWAHDKAVQSFDEIAKLKNPNWQTDSLPIVRNKLLADMGWDATTKTKFGTTPAPSPSSGGEVQTRTLRDGTKVKVRRTPDGKWEQVG